MLCSNKNDRVVRYALGGSSKPVAIASYDLLPHPEKAALPSEELLVRAFEPMTPDSLNGG
ncbi:hypothetical protein GCM10011399_02010 [Subtercola lobariae]|uniref:Uncharacterized protein n=1 Tax=Subtercola lobariae TaxID=1588641 RepID=A0A917B1C4_9MICO|nr:hypothetical protein GCM10011399_02010 [Subtercola lobariae]